MRRHRGIRPADHFKFKVSDKALDGHRRMFLKISGAKATNLFAAKQSKDHRSLWLFPFRKSFGQLQHRGDARGIVIRAVENVVTRDSRAYAQVIEMGRKQDRLFRQIRIAAANYSQTVRS